MDAQGALPPSNPARGPPALFGRPAKLDPASAGRVLSASGDVVLLIDRHGVIRDMALNSDDLARDGARAWLDQRWSDTVTIDSRHKVDELLRDATREGRARWRELNQLTPTVNALMMRYLTVDGGRDGQVIAIGRDDRASAMLQLRLQETQQTMERDYARLRDAEFRHRLLFQVSGEAVIVVDAASKRIVEVNPAAENLVGEVRGKLIGEPLGRIFDADSREEATALLAAAQAASRSACAQTQLWSGGRRLLASAVFFREGRVMQCLLRLNPASDDSRPVEREAVRQSLLEQLPDAVVVTDEALKILAVNGPFLDLVRLPTRERVVGRSLNDFLGRARLERDLLLDTLREHGAVRNFGTVLRNEWDEAEDVEVSALSTVRGGDTTFNLSLRAVRRPEPEQPRAPASHRSTEQLSELVGRVKLKDLVRESTDLVEKLCIEAALELTKNNRASAADLLGVSRQSLYSKLHRFGLASPTDNDDRDSVPR